MKVLIAGDYGFLCNQLAERLEREGNEVYIIRGKNGDKKNKPLCKHVAFSSELKSTKVEDIFKSIMPNTVIFLGAFDEGLWNKKENKGESEFLSGLINFLRCSNMFKVNKFIYLSSAEVYGQTINRAMTELEEAFPNTIRGNLFLEGEALCERWEKSYGLNCLSIRMTELYGARQYNTFKTDFIMELIEKTLNEKPIHINKDKSHSFLYIGDAIDAIYRSLGSTVSNKINVSSNELLNEEEILQIIEKYLGKKTTTIEHVKSDTNSVILDNTLAKRELDWTPLYDIENGIEKTINWVKKNLKDLGEEVEVQKKSKTIKAIKAKEIWDKVYPYLENLVVFLLLLLFNNMFTYHPIFSSLDIPMLYVVLMAVLFGVKQASIAVLLVSGLYVSGLINNGSDLVGALLNFQTMIKIAQYFLIGIAIGYTLDRRRLELSMKDEELDYMNMEMDELQKIHDENLKIKEILEARLIGYGDSFGKIYSMVSKLDMLHPERIIPSAVDVLMEIMKSKKVDIYSSSSEGSYLRLAASSTNDAPRLGKSIRIQDLPELGKSIKKQKIFTNNKLKEDMPMMATGIYYEGNLIYVIFIWDVPFEVANLYHANLLRTVAALISSSLNKAYKYLEATEYDKYISNTKVLKPDIFEEILNAKKIAMERKVSEYSILQIDYKDELENAANNVDRIIRDTDYIGLDKEGNMLVLLSNSNEIDSSIVLKRLEEKKLVCSVVTN